MRRNKYNISGDGQTTVCVLIKLFKVRVDDCDFIIILFILFYSFTFFNGQSNFINTHMVYVTTFVLAHVHTNKPSHSYPCLYT